MQNEEIVIKHNIVKRGFDILFSLLIIMIFTPLFPILILCIYIDSPGPIFYHNERIGRGGKRFKCWKFRTMCVEADRILPHLLKNNPQLQEEWKQYNKFKNDPRVTRFGKILRKTSLDELPQFWNVLKGDLSIVGPRPCVVTDIEENYGSKKIKILSIRPGITGIWQVSGRNNLTRAERVCLEEKYVEQYSFLNDLYLILKTIPAVLFRHGAW